MGMDGVGKRVLGKGGREEREEGKAISFYLITMNF